MAAVTIWSDFRAQDEEICCRFHLFPFYLPQSNRTRCHDLCCCSVAQSCLSLWPHGLAHQASMSFTISQSLLKLMSIQLVMPSNHLLLCHPLLFLSSNFPSIRVFSSDLGLCVTWQKYWRFSFSFSPSNEYSVLISLGLTGLISSQSKGPSRVFSSTTVWKHQFLGAQPSLWSKYHIHVWLQKKTIALTICTLSAKWCLFFNTLSMFVIAFLPRSKRLLI